MLLTKRLDIRINNTAVSYYKKLGYNCKIGDIINIPIKDLTKGSSYIVEVKCDKCECINQLDYGVYYIDTKGLSQEYYCKKCSNIRRKETCLKKFGVDNIAKLNRKRKIRKSYEYIQEKIFEKYKGNIVMLTEKLDYLGSHYKSKFKCNICLNTWEDTFNSVISNKNGCPQCYNKKKKPEKLENIQREIRDKFDIQILTNDENLIKSYKYNFLCNKCGFTWKSNLGNILNQKNACIKCSKGHYRYNLTEIKNMLLKNHHNKIEICDESYISISKPSKFKCLICDFEWSVMTRNVAYGFNGCPSCKRSQGERFVKTFLIENKINYVEQFTFDDCRNKRKLPFDFYIKDDICIEFDGYQHFFPWKDNPKYLNDFKQTQMNDKLKDDYCYNNHIKLIRIPYTEIKNINVILKKELNLQ